MRSCLMMVFAGLTVLSLACGCGSSDKPAAPKPFVPATSGPAARIEDLQLLTGEPWSGTLTYKDFTSSKPASIRSRAFVRRVEAPGDPTWELRMSYPDEPDAESTETMVLYNGGRVIGDEQVVERAELPGGAVRIVTERDGKDAGRQARLRRVFTLGPKEASIQKLVRYLGEGEYFERNIFRWTR